MSHVLQYTVQETINSTSVIHSPSVSSRINSKMTFQEEKCNVINVCNNNSQQVARNFSLAHSNEVRSRFNAHKASLLTLQIEHSAERKPLYLSRFRKLH